MKNIGIVRRLDALGRIVIPREFRKLNRIELGDPLEIRALDNGEIVLKKVDLDAELATFGQMLALAAYNETGKTVMVCGLNKWLSGSGSAKLELIGDDISSVIAKNINERKYFVGGAKELKMPKPFENFVSAPILSDTDSFGAICILSANTITSEEISLSKTLAAIAGKNLQRY